MIWSLKADRLCHTVLGINKSTTARKVVRLLLADSLKEEETWERQLEFQEESHIDDGGILIRLRHQIPVAVRSILLTQS